MRDVASFPAVYLYRDVVDFRKAIDGLAGVVSEVMKQDVFSGALFVFCSRRRNKIKVLYWDRTGYCLWYKRLEEEKFVWPRKHDQAVIGVDVQTFRFFLDGIDVWKMKRHRALEYQTAS